MSSPSIKKSSTTENGPARVHVLPKEGGWQVRREGADRLAGAYRTQAEATEAAKSTLRRSGGELMVQGRDGRIRGSLTLGRDSMAKIAAVEGIHLSPESKRALEDFDRKGTSGDERRRAIARWLRRRLVIRSSCRGWSRPDSFRQ
jgi:hypothetical protein